MARKTDGEKVDELVREVVQMKATAAAREEQAKLDEARYRAELADLRAESRRLADRQAATEAKNAALEQRLAAGEKHDDRTWQAWLALIGAGVAVLVALLKK